MMAKIVTLDMQRLASNLTLVVKIRRRRQWGVRLAIAVWLVRLAAWVAWMGFEVEEIPACADREKVE